MPFEIILNNWKNQRFPVNALMEVKGFLIAKNGCEFEILNYISTDYELIEVLGAEADMINVWQSHDCPQYTLAIEVEEITARSLRVQPGDPENKAVEELRAKPEYKDFDFPLYEDSCLEVECPSVTFSGTVSAIPVPTGDPRDITVDISAYDGKDATESIFSNFSIHCEAEPADKTPADPPMTPRGLKRFRSADSPRSSPAKTPRMMPRPRTPVKDDDVGSLGAIVEEIECRDWLASQLTTEQLGIYGRDRTPENIEFFGLSCAKGR
ncbi:hypothetical protein V8E54_004843 [Elaphomyces granulatus]